MGKHFDGLVELMKKNKIRPRFLRPEVELDIDDYLRKCVSNKVALYDIPLKARELNNPPAKYKQNYFDYLQSFLNLSAKHDTFMVTPHKNTVIENPDSMIFLRNLEGNEFHVTSVRNSSLNKELTDLFIMMGKTRLNHLSKDREFIMGSVPFFCIKYKNGTIIEYDTREEEQINKLSHNISMEAFGYLKQNVYIMDPVNFIIKKINNHAKGYNTSSTRKFKGKKKEIDELRKTIRRPHYTVMDAEETQRLFKEESTEPTYTRPVAGYLRTFEHPRFVNMLGQTIIVESYVRGQGRIDAKNGWQYLIMIKKEDATVVPYDR